MSWNGKRVLVTGGEGFIGSHLVEELVRQGADVRVLALYDPFGRYGWLGSSEVAGDIEILPGDVRDAEPVNVANACRRHDVQRMVHTSTSETYGTAITAPIPESHPMQPQSPYSASKIGADMMALSFHHSFELPVAVVRPFNTYGPRQSTRAVIPTILTQLHHGAKQIHIGATSPTRDFNYVTDTVSGFLAVAASERALGEVVNVGSGEE